MKIYAGLAILTALMIPVAAGAADMRLKAPPPPPPPPFSWNGFYIGGEFGGVQANGTVTDSLFGLSASPSHAGWLAGGVVGYNFQTANNIVFGVEGDFDWTSISTTGDGVPTALGLLQASAKTDWVTSLAGRIGISADQVFYGGGGGGGVLFYVKGGGAWVGNSASITDLNNGLSASASNTNSGWLVGGGLEWAFASNWSAKFEYDYIGLRSWSWSSVLFPAETFTASRNLSEFKVGLNYRFNWGSPVVGRY
jgi:outer membrane immunogenic protein